MHPGSMRPCCCCCCAERLSRPSPCQCPLLTAPFPPPAAPRRYQDKFLVDGEWHTWIDYDKFHQLAEAHRVSGGTQVRGVVESRRGEGSTWMQQQHTYSRTHHFAPFRLVTHTSACRRFPAWITWRRPLLGRCTRARVTGSTRASRGGGGTRPARWSPSITRPATAAAVEHVAG